MTNPLWQRSRLTPVYDREGYLRRLMSLMWVVAFGFFVLFAVVEPRDLFDEEGAMAFSAFVWAGVALLAMVVSASSLVGDRRRGLLELMLAAPIEQRDFVDGSILAVLEHIRRIYWLPVVLIAIFWLVGDPHLLGSLCSLVTATLFLLVLVTQGVLCSLTARHVGVSLAFTFAFCLVPVIGLPLSVVLFGDGSGPVVWIAGGVALFATLRWVRQSATTPAVACLFTAMHVVLVSLGSFWTFDGTRDEFPMFAMHPGVLALVTLDDRMPSEFVRVPIAVVIPCYWAALVANLFWARRFMVTHFDRLVGRTLHGPDREVQPRVRGWWRGLIFRRGRAEPIDDGRGTRTEPATARTDDHPVLSSQADLG